MLNDGGVKSRQRKIDNQSHLGDVKHIINMCNPECQLHWSC